MHLDPAGQLDLFTAFVGLFCVCAIVYRMIVSAREGKRDSVPPPIRLNLYQRLQIALNPGRLRKHAWVLSQATVQQTYLIRHETMGTVFWLRQVGMRTVNPFRVDVSYSYGFWYRYLAKGGVHWGNHRFVVRYSSREEANAHARGSLQKTIAIRYDPDYPDDSQPVLDASDWSATTAAAK